MVTSRSMAVSARKKRRCTSVETRDVVKPMDSVSPSEQTHSYILRVAQ